MMPLLDFSKLDDVIAAANNTRYGLAAYVFTNDLTVAVEDGRGPGGRHHRHQRPGAGDAAVPVRRHEGVAAWAASWATRGWRRTWRRSTSRSSCKIDIRTRKYRR